MKAVVLDVDGVILRHPPTLHKVYRRIERYVSNKTLIHPVESQKVNEVLYKQFGHTFLGLQKMYPSSISLSEFNEYVYTDDIVNSLANSVYNVDMLHHLIDLQRFLETCRCQNVPIYMFSNAPWRWCARVQKVCNLQRWIPERHILSCDHEVFQNNKQSLKPQPVLYQTVQDYLSHEHHSADLDIVFVDDSLCNLIPIMDAPAWTPVLFGDTNPQFESPKLLQLSSFRNFTI